MAKTGGNAKAAPRSKAKKAGSEFTRVTQHSCF